MFEEPIDMQELLEVRQRSESRYNALIIRYEDINNLYQLEERIQALRLRITNDSTRPEDVESLVAASKARKELEAKIMRKPD